VYKESVAFSAGCRSGYMDGARNLEVMLECLSGGRRREIQEDGICFFLSFVEMAFRLLKVEWKFFHRANTVAQCRDVEHVRCVCKIKCDAVLTFVNFKS